MSRSKPSKNVRVSESLLVVVTMVFLLLEASAAQSNGCTSELGSKYSLQQQIDIGRSYAQMLEARSKLIADPVLTQYVNGLGQNLVRNSDARVPFTFKIIESDEVNAFSLPGGFIFLDSGLILAADNEAELAGVIAHEIAHVAACHAAQVMVGERLTNVASMPRFWRLAGRHLTLNTVYVRPSRSFEAEADSLGVAYAYKAGYDPQGLATFLYKVKALREEKAETRANLLAALRINDRVRAIQNYIKTLLPPVAEYKVDTIEFQAVKKTLSVVAKADQR